MPFLDPSSVLLPSYSEAVNSKETIHTCAILYKTKAAANHAIVPKGQIFSSQPIPQAKCLP